MIYSNNWYRTYDISAFKKINAFPITGCQQESSLRLLQHKATARTVIAGGTRFWCHWISFSPLLCNDINDHVTYIYICIYLFTYKHIYICIYVWLYIYIYIEYIYIYIVCNSVHLYMCLHTCMFVYVYMQILAILIYVYDIRLWPTIYDHCCEYYMIKKRMIIADLFSIDNVHLYDFYEWTWCTCV